MPHELEYVDDHPQLIPDPPQAHVQFSVKWKCVNIGDEESPESIVRIDVIGSDDLVVLTAFGRNVVPLLPGETDEDTVGVGAVGSGKGSVVVTVGGVLATIPITL